MGLSGYFAIVASLALVGFGLAAALVSRRQKLDCESRSKTETYHCLRCDSVYVAPLDSKAAVCPKCGYKNSKLKF